MISSSINTVNAAALLNHRSSLQYYYAPNFKLDCGVSTSLRIRYFQTGNLCGPVVVVHPPLSATCQLALSESELQAGLLPNQQVGWWQGIVGPGLAIDTEKFRVFCFDHLLGRSCNLTSLGTSSAAEFPELVGKISPFDSARLAAQCLREAEQIEQIHTVIGASLGGATACSWGEAAIDQGLKLRRVLSISGSFPDEISSSDYFKLQLEVLRLTEPGQVESSLERFHASFSEILQEQLGKTAGFEKALLSIESDLLCLRHLLEEDLSASSSEGQRSLDLARVAVVRKLGLLRFITPAFFDRKHNHLLSRGQTLETWFNQLAREYSQQVSVIELFSLISQIVSPYFTKQRVEASIANSKADFVYHASEGDILFPPGAAARFVDDLGQAVGAKRARFLINKTIGTERGHDFFLCREFVGSRAARALTLYL